MTEEYAPESANAVGYKKPPLQHRFKKGESGNPRGRPKTPETISGILMQELREKITITENGRSKKITKAEVLIKRMVNDGIKGEGRAVNHLIKFMKYFGIEENSGFFESLFEGDGVVVHEEEEDDVKKSDLD